MVVVKRTDVELDSEKGRKLAIADNATAQAGLEWDEEVLQQFEKEWDIDAIDWGLDFSNFEEKGFEEEEFEDKPNAEALNQKEDDEWIGMPDFESKSDYFKIIFNFEYEQDREEFSNKHQLLFNQKNSRTWSTSYPFKENDKVINLKYE